MIMCIGSAADDTFFHTLLALKQAGVSFDVIDFAQLVYSGQVSIPLQDLTASVLSLHDECYTLASYESAWIRLIDITESAPNEKLKRRSAGLYQALNRLFSNVPLRVMNPPLRDCSNFSKLYHAVSLSSIARWCIPRSCLTNNKERALAFIASCSDGAIFKGASAVKTWVTLFNPQHHMERMQLLNMCPVLFQERIDGPDVRVHIVGERIFAEQIESLQLDYRVARNNTYCNIKLPNSIAEGCIALTRACETPFLGIDFKIQRTTGTWFFLEANSMPCYQGYDRRAEGKISRAIVEWLTHPYTR